MAESKEGETAARRREGEVGRIVKMGEHEGGKKGREGGEKAKERGIGRKEEGRKRR